VGGKGGWMEGWGGKLGEDRLDLLPARSHL